MTTQGHEPVLLAAIIDALHPRAGAIYVDGTFGAGGYSRALLDAADCAVWGLDRDPEAVARGHALAADYAGRLSIIQGRFGAMRRLLAAAGVAAVDGVVLDLGVSSMQIDTPARGFSFRADGPLDMRMDPGTGPSAADIVNTLPEDRLAELIYVFGEERHSRRIARAIAAARLAGPIDSTLKLAEIVRAAAPPRHRGPRRNGRPVIDAATRTFQALRIYVNDELGELDRGLFGAESLLAPGGRLAVVSFHSLEDRRVKSFLRSHSGETPHSSRHLPATQPDHAPSFRLSRRRAIRPDAAEIAANPRARSARLRVAERTAAPAWPVDERSAGAAILAGREGS